MKPFIRATEIWCPTADGEGLEFSAGLYGSLASFESISKTQRFAFDEGLPGKAWAARHPLVLKDLGSSYFCRAEAAKIAGLTSAVALPIFAGSMLKAVIVFLCGDIEAHVGAIELWCHDPGRAPGLRLEDGYYGSAEELLAAARNTTFLWGFGLPGSVWKFNMPIFVSRLEGGFRFLRFGEAVTHGITKGFGLPCAGDPRRIWILTFLSALGSPIARRVEIWVPDPQGHTLVFRAGDCDHRPDLANDFASIALARTDGLIGRVWHEGVPMVSQNLADDPCYPAQAAASVGLRSMVALPVYEERAVKAVVAWYS